MGRPELFSYFPLIIHPPDWTPGSGRRPEHRPGTLVPGHQPLHLPPPRQQGKCFPQEPAQAGCSEPLAASIPGGSQARSVHSPGNPALTLRTAGNSDQAPPLPCSPGRPAAARPLPLPAELRAAGDPPGEGRGREQPGEGARGGEAGLGGSLSAAPAGARLGTAQLDSSRLRSAQHGSARRSTPRHGPQLPRRGARPGGSCGSLPRRGGRQGNARHRTPGDGRRGAGSGQPRGDGVPRGSACTGEGDPPGREEVPGVPGRGMQRSCRESRDAGCGDAPGTKDAPRLPGEGMQRCSRSEDGFAAPLPGTAGTPRPLPARRRG